jgi:KDO2-lipid IV(A) lauroyltransferase
MVQRGETWAERAAFWSYRALERVAPVLPNGIGRPLFAASGRTACRLLPRVRETVAANQARALGLDRGDARVRQSTRTAFELYARYWFDSFRLRAMSPAAIAARTEVVDEPHLDAALAHGRGTIAVLLHMGNWDVAGRLFVLKGYRLVTVAEDLRPARLSALMMEHRRALGLEIMSLGDTTRVVRRLQRRLAQGWIVALLADRDLTGNGIEVEMFGARRRVPAGPARLSLATGAPLMVCPVYTTAAGWRIHVGAPFASERSGDDAADTRALSQRMAAAFERAIAVNPSDWHLFQPAWDESAVHAGAA